VGIQVIWRLSDRNGGKEFGVPSTGSLSSFSRLATAAVATPLVIVRRMSRKGINADEQDEASRRQAEDNAL
jgi:hypothetical protein